MARPTKTKQLLKQAGALAQSDAVWECSVRKAPSWTETKSGEIVRTPMIIVADAATGIIRSADLPKSQTSIDGVIQALLRAMLEPMGSQFGLPAEPQMHPERPARVLFDWASRLEEVQNAMGEVGVAVEPANDLPMCDELYQSLLQYMNPGARPPAIARIAPESPALTREYFDAADSFYRSAVWQYVFNDDIIEVRYGDEPARYCSIMGNGGEEFGIVLYNSQEDVISVLSSGHPMEMRRGLVWLTTSFDEAPMAAIEDVDYMEKHGLPPADMMAFPMFLHVKMPASIASPDVIDMKISAAALRVLPQFVVASMMAGEGEPQPASAVMALPAVHEGSSMTLSWPVAGLAERIEQAAGAQGSIAELGDERVLDMLSAIDSGDAEEYEFEDEDSLEGEVDALEAEMIEIAEQVEPGAGRLLQAINSVQPAVSFQASKDVLEMVKPKPKGMKAGKFYEAFSTLYADPRIGIMVAFVLPRNDMPVIIPLTMLQVDASHPLADAIVRYQESRGKPV